MSIWHSLVYDKTLRSRGKEPPDLKLPSRHSPTNGPITRFALALSHLARTVQEEGDLVQARSIRSTSELPPFRIVRAADSVEILSVEIERSQPRSLPKRV